MQASPAYALDDVAVFAKVAAVGSFTSAAQLLGLPKSNVSRAIARLEASLGQRLIVRTTRRMRLTDAGVRFADEAQRAITTLAEAAEGIRSLQVEPRGLLRVTAPVDLGRRVLASVCVAFQQRYQEVQVQALLTVRLVDLVDEGFDLALRSGTLVDSSMVARRLGTVRQCLFASPAWLAAHDIPQAPADLARVAWVHFRHRPGAATVRLTSPEGVVVEACVQGGLSCGDFTFLHAALVAGGGVGPLPVPLAAEDVLAGRLVPVLPRFAVSESPLWAVYPPQRTLPAKTRLFLEFLLDPIAQFMAPLPTADGP